MKKKYLIFVCVLIIQNIGLAQNKNVKAYLPASVTQTAADDGVSIWTGTGRSVVQIDKETKETIFHRNIGGLKDTNVSIVKISPYREIWAGTRAGIARYKNGGWQSWELVSKSGIQATTITAITFDSPGNVWVVAGKNKFYSQLAYQNDTTHIIANFNGITWESFDKSDWGDNIRITNIMAKNDGSVIASGGIIGTNKGIVLQWKNGMMTKFTSDIAFIPPANLEQPLLGLTTDLQGKLWVGGNSGASFLEGNTWKYFKRLTSSKADSLRSGADIIKVSSNGDVWAAGVSGISRFRDGKWKFYGMTQNSHYGVYPTITEMVIDKKDSIWCLTDGGLLCLINDSLRRVSPPSGFLETEMRGLTLSYDGNLLLCGGGSNSGDKGVAIRKNGRWEIYRNTAEPIYIDHIEVDKAGNIWGTGIRGITRFDGNKWDYWGRSTGMSDTNFAIVADKDNNVWITNHNGVSKFDGVDWTHYRLSNKKHWIEYFSSITVDSSNNIWVSHTPYDSVGTFVIDGIKYVEHVPRTTRLHKFNRQKDSFEVISLPSERTTGVVLNKAALVTDVNGNVWFATEGMTDSALQISLHTLYRYGSNGKVDIFDLQNNGFDSTRSRSSPKLIADKTGNIWVGYGQLAVPPEKGPDLDGGIARFNGGQWEYELSDTLNFANVSSLDFDPEGKIWTVAVMKKNNVEFSTVYVKKNNIWHEYTDVDRINTLTFDHSGNMWAIRAGTEIVRVSNAYTVGVEEETPSTENTIVSLYPNPGKEYIDIQTSLFGDIHIRVSTLLGETVLERIQQSESGAFTVRLPLVDIAAGTYFVTIKNDKESFTRMFVKE